MTTHWNCLMPEGIRVWWPWTTASQWRVCSSILLRDSLSLQVVRTIIMFSRCIQKTCQLVVRPHANLMAPQLCSGWTKDIVQDIKIILSLSLSLGGRYVKVWDLLKGGQPLVSLKNHHKTVTSLCLSSNGQRLMSASLDRYGDSVYMSDIGDK